MKGKARLALLLSVLLVLATALSVEAAVPEVSVGALAYCQVPGTDVFVVRATDVNASHLSKYKLVVGIEANQGLFALKTVQRNPTVTMQWTPSSDPASEDYLAPGSYSATVYATDWKGAVLGPYSYTIDFQLGVAQPCPS